VKNGIARGMSTRKKQADPGLSGVSASAVRQFLHQSAELQSWTAEDLAKTLGLDKTATKSALAAMQMVGYIEVTGSRFRNTEAGNAIAKVSKAKPIKKATAEKALDDFLQRVRTVNLERDYLYAVDKVVLFGPYFEGAEQIKDVDVAVELSPKERNKAKLEDREKKQAEEAEAGGKRFKSFVDRRAWGRNKVLDFLKGKSRSLALYALNDEILTRPHKIIYTRGGADNHG
jgi:predicted nucleotidyltransferase